MMFVVFSGLLGVFLYFCGNLYSFPEVSEPIPIRLHDLRLTYYRPPTQIQPDDLLDPYDCFLKNENCELVIRDTGKEIVFQFTHSVYRAYELYTKQNTPILVYQEVPARRWQYMSNCFGRTFTQGGYWIAGGQVEKILADDKWKPISEKDVEVMDIAVYRKLDGSIVHTARVVGRNSDGQVLVNSKSGLKAEEKAIRVCDPVFLY